MRKRTLVATVATAAMVCSFVLGPAGPASAHEARKVGPYQFLVGFGAEPAYVGQQNSVQLILTRGGKAVTTLTDTLKVEVISGSERTTLSLEPTFDPDSGLGTPGDYRAWFFPTAPGKYTFHFTGTIGTEQIDQRFTSGPDTFGEAEDPTSVEFPLKPPTMAELATRVVRDAGRQTAAIARAEGSAKDEASGARILALVGIVVGALGLIVGAAGMVEAGRVRSRSRSLEAARAAGSRG